MKKCLQEKMERVEVRKGGKVKKYLFLFLYLTNTGKYIKYKPDEEKMLSVRAIYDGKKFKLREHVYIKTPRDVIITFLDPPETEPSSDEIHQMIEEGGALDFLNDEREDIYSDADLKVKYR